MIRRTTSDAGNIVTVGPGGEVTTSNADGFFASLFTTKSGNEKRSAEAKEIESTAELNKALAKRLSESQGGQGLSTPVKILIGVLLVGALTGVIIMAKK